MLKQFLKFTDGYKSLPHEVTGFTLENMGSGWYIYAHFRDRNKVTVGRYNTEAEAKSALEAIKNITNCNI